MKRSLSLFLIICLTVSFSSCGPAVISIADNGSAASKDASGHDMIVMPEMTSGGSDRSGCGHNDPDGPAVTGSLITYLIKVNRLAGCVTVYTYDTAGEYSVPVKAMAAICDREKTGSGAYFISEKYSLWRFSNSCAGVYCSRVSDNMLFYALPSFHASLGTLLDEEAGISGIAFKSGSIRLSAEDAKWIYDNCDKGTKVIIYDGPDPGPLGKPENNLVPENGGISPAGTETQTNMKPVLISDGPLRAEAGDRVDFMQGITAADSSGESILHRVKWVSNAVLTAAGRYLILYFVTDGQGNTVMLRRALEIYEKGTLFIYDGEKARAAVQASADRHHAMGISVAVIENGRVVDEIAEGYAVYNTSEMTADTKIRVASVSKLAVAMSAAMLYDEGLIDPEEDIGTYWGADIRNPRFPDTAITIRDIMCHTSSLRSDDSDYMLGVDKTLKQLTSGQVFSYCEPGLDSSYMYNNYAFGVLAVTLELVSGRVLDDYLKENIFGKLGIEASFSTATLKKEELASLYGPDWICTRSVELMTTRPVYEEPGYYIWYYAGNLTISAGDLAKLVAALANDGMYEDTRILSAESVAWLEEPQFTAKDDIDLEFTQCLPLRYRNDMYGREGLYFHTGSAFGVFSLICYDPDTGDGVVVITTGASTGYDDYGVTSVCGDIASEVFDMLKN